MTTHAQIIHTKGSTRVFRAVLPPIGVNTYIVEEDGKVLIIDPGSGIRKTIRELNLESQNANVLLTHCHYDHIAGLAELSGVPVWISAEDLPGLTQDSRNLASGFDVGFQLPEQSAVQELKQGQMNINGFAFQAILTPGHSPGSMTMDFEDWIFTGDFLFDSSIGRTDLPFGDKNVMDQSLKDFKGRYADRDRNILVLPGHMDSCALGHLLSRNPYLSRI